MLVRSVCGFLIVLVSSASFCSLSFAQSEMPRWSSQPIGMDGKRTSSPYSTPSRDASGTRVIVNGQRLDLSGDRRMSSGGLTGANPGVASGIGRLSMPGSTATSVGNNVSISNVRNSTIIIEQRNFGKQISTIGVAPD